jgi:uncharacterized repeat protein (TIGR01451 family)
MKNLFLLLLFIFPFVLSAQTKKLPPAVEWQKSFGGGNEAAVNLIATTDHGYLAVGRSASDALVVKFNNNGDPEWFKTYGGTSSEDFRDVVEVGNGDFICVGTTSSQDGDVTGLHTDSTLASDLWVVRINRSGVIQWSKVFGGTAAERGRVIKRMADGNFLIAGDALSNDGDVTGNHGSADMWLLKLDGQGNLLWQKTYGNANAQYVNSLTALSDNNYAICGFQEYKGYPSNAPPVNSSYIYEEAAVKVDAQGNIIWEKIPLFSTAVNANGSFISKVIELPNQELLSVGFRQEPVNNQFMRFQRLNNATGAVVTTKIGYPPYSVAIKSMYDVYYAGPESAQLLSDGTIISCISGRWGKSYDNATLSRVNTYSDSLYADLAYQSAYTGRDFFGVIALNDDEYVTIGNSDFNAGSGKVLLTKFNARNLIKGTAYFDVNANGVKETNEPLVKKGFVETSKNGEIIVKSALNVSGEFFNGVDTGTFTTNLNLGVPGYFTITPVSKQTVFSSSFKNVDSISFAVVAAGVKNDLQLSLQAVNTMRPGFEASYRIDYSNSGNTVIANSVVKLVKPALTDFVSASITPSSVVDNTITWNTGSLVPFESGAVTVVLRSHTPPAVNLGDTLQLTALISPVTDDLSPADNADTLKQTVRGSMDPNDKQENHNGTLYIEQLQAGQSLTYTIRFQNMGTDTAFNIVVRDTLSDKLDIATLEIIGASHPFQFNLKDDKFAAWTFNNILLPDNKTNEPASHGYITYRIKPKNTLQVGDKVYNSASIYFDFNLPVQTNNHETVIAKTPVPAPAHPVISGLQLGYCGSLAVQKAKILNLPAATSGIGITAKLDATVLPIAADSTVSFTVSSLAAGSHDLTVTYSNVTDTKTTTASFTVNTAATPHVNVTASTTNVVSLANPVIVTAANAGGGGKNPLYTFAWNNSFTNIVQAESSSNTLSILASSLALGDNKVYVKMKTSEDCYAVQTNTDSITIRRDMSTGITDTDNPGQVITIYPNPVNGPITINGLSTGKAYTFTIVNLQGQAVFTKRAANQSTVNITEFKGASGTYWLTIYDGKNNRKLGSVQLIKR